MANKKQKPKKSTHRKGRPHGKKGGKKPIGKIEPGKGANRASEDFDSTMRLNRHIANAGISSRREADELIKTGLVEVNGKIVTEMGLKVGPDDVVKYAGETITPVKPTYILLNKPKDYATSSKDPNDKKTVSTLLRGSGRQQVFSVGRLDTKSSGLLLFTNDRSMAQKLSSPKHGVRKIYHLFLDKNIKPADVEALKKGIPLKDGKFSADDVSFISGSQDHKQIGIEITGGTNALVRRMLEKLGYRILKMDRVMFAGLTKKDLPRGKWRKLGQQEINNLKMLK